MSAGPHRSIDGSGTELNVWQKRQATLLYHFASLDYLKGLKKRIDAFIQGADILLDLVKAQGRDTLIMDPRWGARDTSANWSTYGFPALTDFQQTTARQIAKRSMEVYSITGANQCARMLGELSMRWSTPEEEGQFKTLLESIVKYASYIDYTLERPPTIEDGSYYNIWKDFETAFTRLPKFRNRTDVEAKTGIKPPRTGAYVPQDDPHGALQFAWTGDDYGALGDCVTFNQLGLEAITAVGRDNLWNDSPALLTFVKQKHAKAFDAYLRGKRALFKPSMLDDPSWAPAFISNQGFTSRPCKWHFVEMINGEFEDAAEAQNSNAAGTPQRVAADQPCPQAGWWFTPAKQGSRRYFKQGEVFPAIEGSAYGDTFWQWDTDQSDPKL